MKRTTLHRSKPAQLPRAWREAEFAALRVNAADTCDDRVSENIYDADDERTGVDSIMQAMIRSTN